MENFSRRFLVKFKYTLLLENVSFEQIQLVGGKNASLGEMIKNLTNIGINIPGGFALTVDAYQEFLNYNDLKTKIKTLINAIDMEDLVSLRKGAMQVLNKLSKRDLSYFWKLLVVV